MMVKMEQEFIDPKYWSCEFYKRLMEDLKGLKIVNKSVAQL